MAERRIWYQSHKAGRLSLLICDKALRIDTAGKRVKTTKTEIFCDKRVIATVSDAALPSYLSKNRLRNTKGCIAYRSIADLEGLISYVVKRTDDSSCQRRTFRSGSCKCHA